MISRFRFYFARLVGLCAFHASRLLKRGSGEQIQGRIIDFLCPTALKYAANGKHIIVISSTNGKTTTTRLIAEALKKKYGYVITNKNGANQRPGILSALIDHPRSTSEKEIWAVLEVDERTLPLIFSDLDPKIVVLMNLSRDQLDRYGEVASIGVAWKQMLHNTTSYIIANGSDPNIVNSISGVNSEQTKFILVESSWHEDSRICPNCGHLLDWTSNSTYKCQQCSFAPPELSSTIEPSLVETISHHVNLPGKWNINNAIFAYTVLQLFDISDDIIFSSWETIYDVSGRNAVFTFKQDKTLQLLLAKNPAGWNEMLAHISQYKDSALIFAFNCNIADGKDPSWLYDVDFESMTHNNIVVFGQRAGDIHVRLDVAGKNVVRVKKMTDALNTVFNHSSHCSHAYIVASYTQFLSLPKILKKLGES